MNKQEIVHEGITKALDSAQFLSWELADVGANCGPVEHLIVLELQKEANALQDRIAALLEAVEAGNK